MSTYRVGMAPVGATHVYDLDHLGFVGRVYGPDGAVDDDLTREIETPRAADRICRAFHVEALARAYMAADTFADAAEKRAALFEALR